MRYICTCMSSRLLRAAVTSEGAGWFLKNKNHNLTIIIQQAKVFWVFLRSMSFVHHLSMAAPVCPLLHPVCRSISPLFLWFLLTSCLKMRMNSSAKRECGTGPYPKKEVTPSLTFKTHTCRSFTWLKCVGLFLRSGLPGNLKYFCKCLRWNAAYWFRVHTWVCGLAQENCCSVVQWYSSSLPPLGINPKGWTLSQPSFAVLLSPTV